MRIAVCDDEHLQSDLLCGYVSDWGRARHEPVEISVFRSGEAFLFAWDEDKAWDALLLDIQMDGIDGMALAGSSVERVRLCLLCLLPASGTICPKASRWKRCTTS